MKVSSSVVTAIWPWLAGRVLSLAAGPMDPQQLVHFLSLMDATTYVPEYASELLRQASREGFAAYLSSRNSMYSLQRVEVMNHDSLPTLETFQKAGILVSEKMVRVIHEGTFSEQRFPQRLIASFAVSKLLNISVPGTDPMIEMSFDHSGWIEDRIRFWITHS